MAIRLGPLVAILATTFGMAVAHYNLINPMPYNPIDCNRPDCFGPCPPIWGSGKGKARNSPSRPAAVWRRGQVVDVEWHRNNHEGGYYRRSLVPVKHMFNKNWHRKTAFEWGCWTQGRYFCGKRTECGTDRMGFAYRNKMRVPSVFPDGDYVFAMVWFGGLHWQRKKALFSDYYTCSYVRIRGGQLANSHAPGFQRGFNHRNVAPGTCRSTSARQGECGGQECKNNKPVEDVPGVFRGGRKPPNVWLGDLNKNALAYVPDWKLKTSSQATEIKAEADSKIEELRDAKWATEEQKARNSQQQKQRMSQNTDVCNNKWKAPQKPTGAWGPRDSWKWKKNQQKWWAWNNYCKPRMMCHCWN